MEPGTGRCPACERSLAWTTTTIPSIPERRGTLLQVYADLSPDGSRIVYSTDECVITGSLGPYEIAMANVDCTEQRRLTKTENHDGHPA